MTTVKYAGFTGPKTWHSLSGDADLVHNEFSAWVTAINENASQLARQAIIYYTPDTGSSRSENNQIGSLASFPQSSLNDDALWFGWWKQGNIFSVQLFNDWEFGPINNGYGRPDPDANGTQFALSASDNNDSRGYLIGSSTEDNKEFFSIAYDGGPASQYQNAWIVFKASNGTWVGAAYGPTSNTAFCYSTTNNTWNLNSNSRITSPTVLLPLAHSFVTNPDQDYIVGEFTVQTANPNLYSVDQLSQFGAYSDLQDGTYVASMGYKAFWIRYGEDAAPTPPPTTTFNVTVVNTGSNVFSINGVNQDTLQLTIGSTYVFDQSDPSNSGHPLLIYLDAGKTGSYTDGVTQEGIPGSAGARTTFTVPTDAPAQLYYQCQVHGGMGGLPEVA